MSRFLVLSPKSGQAPQNPTGKIRGCPDNREPLAEVIALSHLCPHLRMHVEVFGPIAEERAGTSKSYCGVIKVRIISGRTKTYSKGALASLTLLRDIPSDQMACRHSGRRGSKTLLQSTCCFAAHAPVWPMGPGTMLANRGRERFQVSGHETF
jgi:hypothetical protein